MKKTILALATLLLLFTACKKDKKNASDVTVQNLSGSYLITKITAQDGSGSEADVTNAVLKSCEMDNVIKLNSDLTLQMEDKGTLCSPPANYSGNWSLTNSSTIEIKGQQGTIRKFDGKNLEVSIVYPPGHLITYYVKQ